MDCVLESKQKFFKSRNGCVTCKARRVKCDETKPICEQCTRRRITCGGYKIDVRWKQASEPERKSPPRRKRPVTTNQARKLPGISRKSSTTDDTNRCITGNEPSRHGHEDSLSGDNTDLAFLDSNLRSSSLILPSSQNLEFLMQDFNQDLSLPAADQVSHGSVASPPHYSHHYAGGALEHHAVDFASESRNMESFWEEYLRPVGNTPHETGLAICSPGIPDAMKTRRDEVERMAFLFHQQTCHTLSIQEDLNNNPWKTLIWPMAKEHPALWYALAALTCFCMSKQQPQLRIDGARHVRRSAQILTESVGDGVLPLDAALAATLGLGFAVTWDYENSSAGISHIQSAGLLLSQLLSDQGNMNLNLEATRFLYNTWTYMDVLARFTCNDVLPLYSSSTPIPNWSERSWDTSSLDPLMGYSMTFFPVMRRVADLINRVRARLASRNSPAIVAQALELKRIIEDWTPPVDLEAVQEPSPNMTDAIQTAEAYRWSTLCLLYQAVPELPNLTSYGELAQKILVYLATIPVTSATIIVHILPLMVAGCDAVDDEDTDFVRERWKAMSKRMVTGVVDLCLKITEEVWKRREEYLWARGLSFTASGFQVSSAANNSTALSREIADFINFGNSSGTVTSNLDVSTGKMVQCNTRSANGFPISAAFKKGVDTLTRSGCSEYTVRGRLHWLGVMKDWNWQFMLG